MRQFGLILAIIVIAVLIGSGVLPRPSDARASFRPETSVEGFLIGHVCYVCFYRFHNLSCIRGIRTSCRDLGYLGLVTTLGD